MNKAEVYKDISEVTIDKVPDDLPGFWEASKEEQEEIDRILEELNLDGE